MPKNRKYYVQKVAQAMAQGKEPKQSDLEKALKTEATVSYELRFIRDELMAQMMEIATGRKLAPKQFMKMISWAQHACERHQLLHEGSLNLEPIEIGYAVPLPAKKQQPPVIEA